MPTAPLNPPELNVALAAKLGGQGFDNIKSCYWNSQNAMLHMPNRENCKYIEGYLVLKELENLPIEHAWLLDDRGAIVDTTLVARDGDRYGFDLYEYHPVLSLSYQALIDGRIFKMSTKKPPFAEGKELVIESPFWKHFAKEAAETQALEAMQRKYRTMMMLIQKSGLDR
jgi:hypothetical protein